MSDAKPSRARLAEVVHLPEIIRRATEGLEASGHFERVEKQLATEAAQKQANDARYAAGAKGRQFKELLARGIPKRPARRLIAGDYFETEATRAVRALGSELLVLGGPSDGGKSFAAALAVANGPPLSRFVHVRELSRLSMYRADEMDPVEKAPVLAIDDLAVEFLDDKGMFEFVLDSLLDARWSAELPTVITTNLNMAEFSERFGERIVSRLRDGEFVGCAPLNLRGVEQ